MIAFTLSTTLQGLFIAVLLTKASLGGSLVKNPPAIMGDLRLIPGLGRSPGEGKDYPLQYSGLENSVDCIVHGVAKSRTRLSNFHLTSLPST